MKRLSGLDLTWWAKRAGQYNASGGVGRSGAAFQDGQRYKRLYPSAV
jgi:hypothetical protein